MTCKINQSPSKALSYLVAVEQQLKLVMWLKALQHLVAHLKTLWSWLKDQSLLIKTDSKGNYLKEKVTLEQKWLNALSNQLEVWEADKNSRIQFSRQCTIKTLRTLHMVLVRMLPSKFAPHEAEAPFVLKLKLQSGSHSFQVRVKLKSLTEINPHVLRRRDQCSNDYVWYMAYDED